MIGREILMRAEVQKEVVEIALTFFKKWSTGLVERAFYDARDEAVQAILEKKGVEESLSEDDIRSALQDVVHLTQKDLDDLSPEELRNYITDRVLTERDFVVVYPLYGVYEFPKETKIGNGSVVPFTDLPAEAREMFEGIWEREFKHRPWIYKTLEEFLEDRRDTLLVEFGVKACGVGRAQERARESAEDSLMILRTVYDHPFSLADVVVYSEGRGCQASVPGYGGWIRYNPAIKGEIDFWTDIIVKPHPTDLEGRMRRAHRLAGLSVTVQRRELAFVVLTIGLETLLLSKGDRDYLRYKLAEKAAFLLEVDRDKRVAIFERVKDIYNKRSGIVHSGLGEVSENDLDEVRAIFWRLVRRTEELRDQGYQSLTKTDGQKSVDELIESLKFQ